MPKEISSYRSVFQKYKFAFIFGGLFISIFSILLFCCGVFLSLSSSYSTYETKETNKEVLGEKEEVVTTNLKILNKQNEVTQDETILISGTVSLATTKVTVNETEVGFNIDEKNKTFAHWMPLAMGKNIFEVKAYNSSDNLGKTYKHIVIREKIPEYKVVSVVDGDTIKLDYEGEIAKVRLIGIDSPEKEECYFHQSKEYLQKLIKEENVRIKFDNAQDKKDKYNRILVYIWQENVFINKEMIRQGYAKEYTYKTAYKYQTEFKIAQEDARQKQKGLWGKSCNCEKGEEKSRTCTGCNKAEVRLYNWDCSTYTKIIPDSSCSSVCFVPPSAPTYVCDCNKTCSEITSCEEAYFLLNCGCKRRDGNNNGVPCENICQ